MIIEGIISIVFFTIFLAINRKLRNIKVFMISGIISVLVFLILISAFNMNFKPFILPITLLLIYQPLRIVFNHINKRDPILYIRGVQLTPQEDFDLKVSDYIYSFILVSLPFLILIIFALMTK